VWRVARAWKERAKRAAGAQWRHLQPVAAGLKPRISAGVEKLRGLQRRLAEEIKARWTALQR
jgi:hypothetical protein